MFTFNALLIAPPAPHTHIHIALELRNVGATSDSALALAGVMREGECGPKLRKLDISSNSGMGSGALVSLVPLLPSPRSPPLCVFSLLRALCRSHSLLVDFTLTSLAVLVAVPFRCASGTM